MKPYIDNGVSSGSDASVNTNANLPSATDYRVFYVLSKSLEVAEHIRNPFAGKSVSSADLSPIDRALNLISD